MALLLWCFPHFCLEGLTSGVGHLQLLWSRMHQFATISKYLGIFPWIVIAARLTISFQVT